MGKDMSVIMQKRVKWGKREKTESKKTGGNVRNDMKL